jgi:ribosomal protein S18 acetylase RimI-like enzyme
MDVTIREHVGPHRDLAWSFREAEDSEQALDSYIDLGRVWVALDGEEHPVGHLQAVARDSHHWEITNTAVAEAHRGQGVGRALIAQAVSSAREDGVAHLILATAAADTGNLRFYQRCGFRLTHVVPDVFTPANGYPAGLEVDGIPMLDQVWLERAL